MFSSNPLAAASAALCFATARQWEFAAGWTDAGCAVAVAGSMGWTGVGGGAGGGTETAGRGGATGAVGNATGATTTAGGGTRTGSELTVGATGARLIGGEVSTFATVGAGRTVNFTGAGGGAGGGISDVTTGAGRGTRTDSELIGDAAGALFVSGEVSTFATVGAGRSVNFTGARGTGGGASDVTTRAGGDTRTGSELIGDTARAMFVGGGGSAFATTGAGGAVNSIGTGGVAGGGASEVTTCGGGGSGVLLAGGAAGAGLGIGSALAMAGAAGGGTAWATWGGGKGFSSRGGGTGVRCSAEAGA
ncbi:MAG TPA: hypothetical protein VGK90_12225 [Rhizomicrobium sp.]